MTKIRLADILIYYLSTTLKLSPSTRRKTTGGNRKLLKLRSIFNAIV